MEGMVEWQKEGTRIIVAQSPNTFLTDGYHRKRVGLNHIAFRTSSRAAVRQLYRNYLPPKKIPTLYGGPKEWKDYDPGYYAVYFEDPDRIKLELVYVPGDLYNETTVGLPVGVVDSYPLSVERVDSAEPEPYHLDNASHLLLTDIRLNRTLRSRRIRHHHLPDHVVLAW